MAALAHAAHGGPAPEVTLDGLPESLEALALDLVGRAGTRPSLTDDALTPELRWAALRLRKRALERGVTELKYLLQEAEGRRGAAAAGPTRDHRPPFDCRGTRCPLGLDPGPAAGGSRPAASPGQRPGLGRPTAFGSGRLRRRRRAGADGRPGPCRPRRPRTGGDARQPAGAQPMAAASRPSSSASGCSTERGSQGVVSRTQSGGWAASAPSAWSAPPGLTEGNGAAGGRAADLRKTSSARPAGGRRRAPAAVD